MLRKEMVFIKHYHQSRHSPSLITKAIYAANLLELTGTVLLNHMRLCSKVPKMILEQRDNRCGNVRKTHFSLLILSAFTVFSKG